MPSLSASGCLLIRTGRHLIVNYLSFPSTCQLQNTFKRSISSSYTTNSSSTYSGCSTLSSASPAANSTASPTRLCGFLRTVKMSTSPVIGAPTLAPPSPTSASSAGTGGFYIEERGTPNTLDYRIYFRNASGPISPFHDIPCVPEGVPEGGKIFNMVVEIPRWTNHKMEIATKDPLNPIKQDIKKEKLRFVANCFPHHGYIWNYGALPQTWENPNKDDEFTGCKGDNDPIDVCEIGSKIHPRGSIVKVKVLGCYALIDEGETDWKILAIDVTDPLAEKLNDIQDIEKWMPGFLRATCEWFRIYKIPDGKPENQFAFNGEPKSCEFALKAIAETRKHWNELINKECENDSFGISCAQTTDPNAKTPMTYENAEEVVKSNPRLSPEVPIDQMALYHCQHTIRKSCPYLYLYLSSTTVQFEICH